MGEMKYLSFQRGKRVAMEKPTYRVFDQKGQDVTDKEDWLLGPDGTLYMETSFADYPFYPVGDSYVVVWGE